MASRQRAPASQQQQHDQQPLSHKVAKTATAVSVGGGLMVLSALTLAATVIGLVIATPVMVLFSPVLVPAAITVFLLLSGFLTSGGLGVLATGVLTWMYKYVSGKHPAGADQLDRVRDKIAGAAKDMKDKAEQIGHETTRGGQGT